MKTETYYTIMVFQPLHENWQFIPRVPKCYTLEEAECYYTLIKLGKWRINATNTSGTFNQFVDNTQKFKLVKCTLTEEDIV